MHEIIGSANVLRSALFLDRDGTINRHIGYLDRPDQIELLPGVSAAIRRLNQAGVLAVVVTNQAVIARSMHCGRSRTDSRAAEGGTQTTRCGSRCHLSQPASPESRTTG